MGRECALQNMVHGAWRMGIALSQPVDQLVVGVKAESIFSIAHPKGVIGELLD